MGTPSEILAGRTLQRILRVREIKFINGAYDFEARDETGLKYCIEVKSNNELRLRQMNALAQEFSRGKVCCLFVIHEGTGHYCLFKLVSSDLFPLPLKKLKVHRKRVKIQTEPKITEEEFIGKVRSLHRVTIPEWVREELGIKVGTKVRVTVDLAKKPSAP